MSAWTRFAGWVASKVDAVVASPSVLSKCSSPHSVCIFADFCKCLSLSLFVRLSVLHCLGCVLYLFWCCVLVALVVIPSACYCGFAFGRADACCRPQSSARARILSSTRSPLFFAVLLQSPLSFCDAVSLFLMLLSLASQYLALSGFTLNCSYASFWSSSEPPAAVAAECCF